MFAVTKSKQIIGKEGVKEQRLGKYGGMEKKCGNVKL